MVLVGGGKIIYDNHLYSELDWSEYFNGMISGKNGRAYKFEERSSLVNSIYWIQVVESRDFQNQTEHEKQNRRLEYFNTSIKPTLPARGVESAESNFYKYAKNIERYIKRDGFLYDFEMDRISRKLKKWRSVVDNRKFQKLTEKQQNIIREKYYLSEIVPRMSDVDFKVIKVDFNQYANKIEASVKKNGFFVDPLPLPKSGYKLKNSSLKYVTPLKIITRGNNVNYFVKLSSPSSKKPVLRIFIRGGESVSTEMPAGEYIMKYAIGNTWYGQKYLFGPKTEFAMAEDSFIFTVDSLGASGYTVELFQQINGNLKTKDIGASQW